MPVCSPPAHEVECFHMGKQRADISRVVLKVAVDRDDQIAGRVFESRVECR